jgi:hypothetical protein
MNIVSPRVRLPLVELANPTRAEIDGVLAQLGALYSDYLIGSASPQEHEARSERPHPRRTGV